MPEVRRLKSMPIDICVASTGRLIDMLNRDALTLERVTFFVVDEARY